MKELEKKVFREVFVGKAVRFDNKEQLDNIKRFYKEFNVGNLGYEYIGSFRGERGLIKLNDNLNVYYLYDIIYEMKYTFDFLLQEYKETLRRKKMKDKLREQFLREFEGIGVRVDNKEEQTKVYEIFNKYGFGWVSGSYDEDVCFNDEVPYITISSTEKGIVKTNPNLCVVIIEINELFKRVKEFEARVHWQPYTLDPKKASSDFKLDADVMGAGIMRGLEATSLYNRDILGIREEYKPLPNKIAFRNDTTTLVYDDFKVVRAKASNKDEAIRETGLLIALLKALKVKDYNTIIANAWDTENELTRHFYLYGVVQQLYVDKKLLSRNQFNKLFEAVGDKKPSVNIGGEIIELEYK